MKLSPREIDKMMVSMAAIVARKRLDRGVKLNYPEAVSIISDYVVEGARDGKSVAELMESAAHVLKKDDCMEGVAEGYLLGRPLGQLDMVGDTEIEGLIVAVSLNKTHTSASN